MSSLAGDRIAPESEAAVDHAAHRPGHGGRIEDKLAFLERAVDGVEPTSEQRRPCLQQGQIGTVRRAQAREGAAGAGFRQPTLRLAADDLLESGDDREVASAVLRLGQRLLQAGDACLEGGVGAAQIHVLALYPLQVAELDRRSDLIDGNPARNAEHERGRHRDGGQPAAADPELPRSPHRVRDENDRVSPVRHIDRDRF